MAKAIEFESQNPASNAGESYSHMNFQQGHSRLLFQP